MVTEKSRAHYALVSRLKRAGLPFYDLVQGSPATECGIILTTAEEALALSGAGAILALEDLDDDPEVFMGQVVSKLDGTSQEIRVGVDPGKRIGLAVFYGEKKLGTHTHHSPASVAAKVAAFSAGIPSSEIVVRVGNGDRSAARKLVESIHGEAPRARIELVDESGTSLRTRRAKGIPLDQSSASRIAFRKGSTALP